MMAAPIKKKGKRRSKLTLAEFKAWLEGVEELQPENWAPNHDQWELIRSRINGIIEPVPEIVKEVVQPPTNPLLSRPDAPVQPPVNPAFAAPPAPSSIPEGPVVKTHDGTAYVPSAVEAPPQMPTTDGGRSKTPNIDTTDGSYESSFG